MSQVRELLTPEGVPLRLELADAGERVLAFVIDVGGMVLFLVVLTLGSIAVLRVTDWDLAKVVWLLGFFLLRNFYFALFELRPRAATPGKRLMGIRVAARNGGRLKADAILARNLVRELELFLPLSVVVLGGSAGVLAVLLGLGWAGLFRAAAAVQPRPAARRRSAGRDVGGAGAAAAAVVGAGRAGCAACVHAGAVGDLWGA